GHISLSQIKKSAGALKGRGMAITGLILGYLWIAFWILVSIVLPVFTSAANDRAHAARSLSNAKQIVMACQLYAIDNEGNFPPSLDALFPQYLTDKAILNSPFATDKNEAS